MSGQVIAPYGTWASPITADLIVSKTVGLAEPSLRGASLYWIEQRPDEAGRSALVQRDAAGLVRDVLPAPYNARTRVHEYGGGAYLVVGHQVYFTHLADQRLYVAEEREVPEPLTEPGELRYADLIFDRWHERLICVREDHRVADLEPISTIAAISLRATDRGRQSVLVSGADFYSSPRLSPDGRRIAWLAWQHPNMPWDGTELWMAGLAADGTLVDPRPIAGGPEESITQPRWSPDGTLYFISDRSGWWNLYRMVDGAARALAAVEAEFAGPQWQFGESSYGFGPTGDIICTYMQNGVSHLGRIAAGSSLQEIACPYTQIGALKVRGDRCVLLASSPLELPAIVGLDLRFGTFETVQRSGRVSIEPDNISVGEPIEYPSGDNRCAHAFYYAPKNARYRGPENELPPLLVTSHGGPTSSTHNGLKLGIQYFTGRGCAVLDVNYGGSSGYGRSYRERLNGQWGVVDVDDCANGALYLANQGRVDRRRMAIRGGSAGGYTTLAALAFRAVFSAGASQFGVSDLEALAADTHKFESRYLERLIGPYPECRALYQARSPIHAVEQLSCPMIFFQGLDDRVVPPDQAERMVEALRQKRLPVAYLGFAGEQHGFRQAKNIKRALEAELYFYSKVFGFGLAETIEPVTIDNLP
ncbi:MAG: S9 family peptidase [Gammaproteobacteria bacterium]